jgi:signal transduction histidine kinase
MQISFFKNQNPSKIYLLGLAVLFILAILYTNIIENNLGNRLTTAKIQKTISSKEIAFDQIFSKIKTSLSENNSKFYFTDKQIENIRKRGVNFFIYKNDSLISWTDNEAIPKIQKLSNSKEAFTIKLSDGNYFAKTYNSAVYKICATYLLSHSYPFENEYLNNSINKNFGLTKKLYFDYLHKSGDYLIHNNNNSILFRINFAPHQIPSIQQAIILFLLYFLILALIFNFIYVQLKRKLKNGKLFLIYSFIIIGIRIIIHFVRAPDILFNSGIFSPGSYAYSQAIPSLGDLFFTVYSILTIILAGNSASKPTNNKNKIQISNRFTRWGLSFILLLASYILFAFALLIIKNLIINSNIHFDLSDFFDLNYLSIIGLVIIGLTLISVLIILYRFFDWYNILLSTNKQVYGFALVFAAVILIWNSYNQSFSDSLVLLYIILLLLLILNSRQKRYYQLQNLIPVLLVLSFVSAIAMNSYNHEAEQQRRKSIVRSVAINQDPQAEYLFHEIEKHIYKDTLLIQAFHNNQVSFDSISNIILTKYFQTESHWKKYDLQLTICDQEQELVIKPDNITILCNDFFYRNLISYGELTKNKNLYHLNYGTGQINYLGLFRFTEHTLEGSVTYTIYLEINSKLKRKGFTKLLSEKGNDPFEKIRNYSLAAYDRDTLIEYYGQYSFPEILENYMKSDKEMLFINRNSFNHLVYRNNDREVYVLSKKTPEQLSIIAPFSYLFILFAILFILGVIIYNHSLIEWKFVVNFTTRLQLSMILIIIISFAIISYFSAHYIVSLNNEKNNQRLKYLSTSLQMEFEHKVSNVDVSETGQNADYLQSLSNKFSKVFDTDINLYDLQGNLITTTRPEIFAQNLLSYKMNPSAFYRISKEKESFFVTRENIGSLVYSSAFLPFHNSKKEVVAYLNLPYFARQSELQSEISSFLMTLMNVYTFIIVLSIIVILLISNYISRPLRMIKEKLQKLTLGAANEKIEWKGDDEIGKLVDEYNRMAEQLSIKADLLAQSERESAWREMAKQVAHEIKNPLTPMKLSVQYLLRSWNEKDPDWEDRLLRLSETLIQQIDTLSDIATAFSDFAKMPKSNNEKINLDEIIQHAIELYADYENLQINFSYHEDHNFYIYADRTHLLRVFNNLIKNAIQSFEINQNGFIDIDIKEDFGNYSIRIRDNGCGIPEDKKGMIFVPNFTTKSKGTGLGLAMVKNIILSFGGNISFESEEGKGTVFTILLPKYEQLSISNSHDED